MSDANDAARLDREAYIRGLEKDDELATLRAEVERLRALLEPFGKAADGFDSYNIKNPEEWFAYGGVQGSGEATGAITVGDLRRARAALAEEKNG
jgi:hypothetical protein